MPLRNWCPLDALCTFQPFFVLFSRQMAFKKSMKPKKLNANGVAKQVI